MALDELIDQLVDRAEGVRQAQGRLRALLRAFGTVTGELSLDAVLRNIVESAVALTGAQHAALVLVDERGHVRDVVHTGMAPTALARLTDPREGPRIEASLSAPVWVAGRVFGVIHLVDSTDTFSPDDKGLLRSLAAAASTGVTNARLYEESRRQHEWLRGNALISQRILSDDGEDPLDVVARLTLRIADADVVAVTLLSHDEDVLVVEAGAGERGAELVGTRFPVAGSLGGRALAEGAPVTVERYRDAASALPEGLDVLDGGPAMVVPLIGSQRTWGTLSVIRREGRPPFTDADLAMSADFGRHASIALELGQARAAEHRAALLEDRDRIARDLHDHVIQELFAIGLSLQATAAMPGVTQDVQERLLKRTEELDRAIRRVRTSIFALRGTADHAPDQLRAAVLDVAGELSPLLGFSPAVTFSGAAGIVDSELLDDVVAVGREALTNVARHSGASSCSVDLTVTTGELVLTVEDDGAGLRNTHRASGTANLRARAERRGGSCSVSNRPYGGVLLTWKVPVA